MPDPQAERLIASAVEAARAAYCPYSGYAVGAALLAPDGRVFQGCNVENASYGLSLCAERSAVSAAVIAGARTFVAVAIAARGGSLPYPCGACRQVLAEFCGPELTIYLAGIESGQPREATTLGALFPKSFRLTEPAAQAVEPARPTRARRQ